MKVLFDMEFKSFSKADSIMVRNLFPFGMMYLADPTVVLTLIEQGALDNTFGDDRLVGTPIVYDTQQIPGSMTLVDERGKTLATITNIKVPLI